ncbi:MAG: hypothetical protein EA402_09745 [Planctomycetota bacterium]|nr:MAG: hypothetical protein EA402_09745 [Planctomycetota bacterium]
MFEQLQTHRLSPKNQLTLLRGDRGLHGVEKTNVVCALPHRMRMRDGSPLPVILLLTEDELRLREERIRAREDVDNLTKERRIALLNGHVRLLNVDGQRRIVLPPHFVRLLQLDREVFMFASNTGVTIWRPEDWQRFSTDQADDDLDEIMI